VRFRDAVREAGGISRLCGLLVTNQLFENGARDIDKTSSFRDIILERATFAICALTYGALTLDGGQEHRKYCKDIKGQQAQRLRINNKSRYYLCVKSLSADLPAALKSLFGFQDKFLHTLEMSNKNRTPTGFRMS
jgi:hypothetical protein